MATSLYQNIPETLTIITYGFELSMGCQRQWTSLESKLLDVVDTDATMLLNTLLQGGGHWTS